MNLLDGIFGALALAIAIRAGLRGFARELMAMLALAAAIAAAVFGYKALAPAFRSWLPGTAFPEVIAFIALFAVVFLVMKLLEKSVGDLSDRMGAGGADHLLGVVFGLVESFLLVCLVLLVLELQTFFDMSQILAGSWCARTLLPLVATPEAMAKLRPLLDSMGAPAVPVPAAGP